MSRNKGRWKKCLCILCSVLRSLVRLATGVEGHLLIFTALTDAPDGQLCHGLPSRATITDTFPKRALD